MYSKYEINKNKVYYVIYAFKVHIKIKKVTIYNAK